MPYKGESTLRHNLHELWEQALSRPGYDKNSWVRLQYYIAKLEMIASLAAESQEGLTAEQRVDDLNIELRELLSEMRFV